MPVFLLPMVVQWWLASRAVNAAAKDVKQQAEQFSGSIGATGAAVGKTVDDATSAMLRGLGVALVAGVVVWFVVRELGKGRRA